jgi:hypothetical protein
MASVGLQIILWLRNTNKLSGAIAGERQLILSICKVYKIQLVNTISLCMIIFYFVQFAVLIGMC